MKVFLASSNESLEDLQEIASWLEELGHEPIAWDMPSLFLPGDNTFLKLIEISKKVDAAVFVFSEDDSVWYRTDTLPQPRDNVLIEYGLFAGALGQRRAIICRKGQPKSATDLNGIIVVDISQGKKQRARLRFNAWMQNLAIQKEEPVLAELILQRDVLKKELEGVKDQLTFELQKSKDLQALVTKHGLTDFSRYDTDAHWKLLFDYNYFMEVTSFLVKTFHVPSAWHTELVRCQMSNVVKQINWDHMKDHDRTRFYVAKALRVFRSFEEPKSYTNYLNQTSKSIRSKINAIGESRIQSIQQDQDQEL